MNEMQTSQTELLGRIDLIESMIQESRRSYEYWGWSQVLWGAAYLIAIVWSQSTFQPRFAWPVTMMAAIILTIVISRMKTRAHPQTIVTRALRAAWTGVAIALFLFCFSVGLGGHFEIHTLLAAVESLLGVANFTAAMVLRWRAHYIVTFIWWAAAVATCFVPAAWVLPILAVATLFGMIAFGLYLMLRERRDRELREQHA